MESSLDLEKRVSILEVEMNWATGTVQDIKKDLEILKNSQFQLLDRLMEYKSNTDERFSSLQAHMNERFSSLQADTVQRISTLQAHTDERISSLQAHNDEKFIAVHDQFANVHKEISGIHRAISVQTKWLLTVILAAATIVSVLLPLMLKIVN